MVTIEQKLTLFSKLLNQDIREETNRQFSELEKEYEKRIAENKFQVDKEATGIVEQARHRAELKRVELISKGKLSLKREMMMIKETLIARFMSAFEERVKEFTKTEGYRVYLESLIKDLESLKGQESNLVVHLTEWDYHNNQEFIKEAFERVGIDTGLFVFSATEEDILGGMIITDPVHRTRIDESIRAVIEDKKDEVIEKISLAIGEVGEEVHE